MTRPADTSPGALDVGHCTERGGRPSNEDAVRVGDGFAVVADGVGGHPDGGRASRLAVDAGADWLRSCPGDPVPGLLALPVVAADALATARPAVHPGAATGLAAVRIHGTLGYAVAVGDCRVATMRRGLGGTWSAVSSTADQDGLALAARDVAAALRLGRSPEALTERGAAAASARLLSAIRVHSPREAEAPVLVTPLRPGDVVLLTTDGVHDVLGGVGLAEWLERLGPGARATRVSAELVRAALAQGSSDNCTVAAVVVPGRESPTSPG